MKNKVVRLTESDLEKLVQKIIKEDGDNISQGLETKSEKLSDSMAFNQLIKAIKSKPVDEQVNTIMTLLKQMDLKGNFGAKFKVALKQLG